MPTEKTSNTILSVDVAHGGHYAEPGAGILGKLWVRRLKEDLDAVERSYDCFGLQDRLKRELSKFDWGYAYNASCESAR